jgi:hypothetical protein
VTLLLLLAAQGEELERSVEFIAGLLAHDLKRMASQCKHVLVGTVGSSTSLKFYCFGFREQVTFDAMSSALGKHFLVLFCVFYHAAHSC